MTGRRAINIAHGALNFAQRDFNRATNIGDIGGAENDQATMPTAALGIASQLNRENFTVGGFNGLIRGKYMRAGPGPGAKNTDRAIFLVDIHDFMQLIINIGNH